MSALQCSSATMLAMAGRANNNTPGRASSMSFPRSDMPLPAGHASELNSRGAAKGHETLRTRRSQAPLWRTHIQADRRQSGVGGRGRDRGGSSRGGSENDNGSSCGRGRRADGAGEAGEANQRPAVKSSSQGPAGQRWSQVGQRVASRACLWPAADHAATGLSREVVCGRVGLDLPPAQACTPVR